MYSRAEADVLAESDSGEEEEMLTRIITAIVSLVVFGFVLAAGETVFNVAIGIIILAMLYELCGALTKSKALKVLGFLCSVILMASANSIALSVTALITLTMVFLVFLHSKVEYREVFSVSFMSVYVTLFMSFIPRMRSELGLAVMAIIFVIAWGSDTFAYFSGTFFGKHKLIPKVSPKKTVEGAVGAVIGTALLCVLYVWIMAKVGYPLGGTAPNTELYLEFALTGAAGSILSQLGDLAASAIKRDAGIKDYGKIFPGHGGFMDRFDSVLFIAPIVYYMIAMI